MHYVIGMPLHLVGDPVGPEGPIDDLRNALQILLGIEGALEELRSMRLMGTTAPLEVSEAVHGAQVRLLHALFKLEAREEL